MAAANNNTNSTAVALAVPATVIVRPAPTHGVTGPSDIPTRVAGSGAAQPEPLALAACSRRFSLSSGFAIELLLCRSVIFTPKSLDLPSFTPYPVDPAKLFQQFLENFVYLVDECLVVGIVPNINGF